MVHYNLEPTVYSLHMLKKVNEFVAQQEKCVNVHIELETGMNRHGINVDELDDLVEALSHSSPLMTVKGIYSHFCGQDDYMHAHYPQF